MTEDEALAILESPEGHSQAEIDEAILLTIGRTDNGVRPEDGEQPEQPDSDFA